MIILMSTELITIIIVCVLCGVLVIVGLYLLIEKFFLTKRRCKRTILALERKYEYLHSLLLGQDAQYIQRLELLVKQLDKHAVDSIIEHVGRIVLFIQLLEISLVLDLMQAY